MQRGMIGLTLGLLFVVPCSVEVAAQGSPATPAPEPSPVAKDSPETPGGGPSFEGGANSDGTIESTVTGSGGNGGGNASPGPATYGPACTWTPASTTTLGGVAVADDAGTGDNDAHITDRQGRTGWLRFCPGDLEATFVWLADVDPIDLVPAARQRAVAQLPLPVPDMSPAPDAGSFVNLGLWLAVEDPGVTTARATLTPGVWAQVEGRFESFSFDPGNGDEPVTCDGFGTPYPEGADTFDEGECGYTYTQPSPSGEVFTITYTVTYSLAFSTSDGRGGSLGTLSRSSSFPYDVNEIQTVGAPTG